MKFKLSFGIVFKRGKRDLYQKPLFMPTELLSAHREEEYMRLLR